MTLKSQGQNLSGHLLSWIGQPHSGQPVKGKPRSRPSKHVSRAGASLLPPRPIPVEVPPHGDTLEGYLTHTDSPL